MPKKILFLINHLEISNGIAKVAIDITNFLAENTDFEIHLKSIYKYDKGIIEKLSPKVKTGTVFGFYFRGLTKIVEGLIPDKLLYKMAVKEKYDIEIGFCYGPPQKIIAVSDNKNAKHYAWMHGYDEGLVLRDYYAKYDRIYCVSKFNANRLKSELKQDVFIDYCYNLLDEERIKLMGEESIDIQRDDEMLFVTVGRLSTEKGYSRLLDITKRLKDEGFRLKLWIVGGGALYSELEEKVKTLDLGDCVTLLGEQQNPHKYTAKADVFVCSSFSEGYSTAATEAILLNVPVITTNVSGGEEIIDDSKAGILCGLDDESLYQAMKKALETKGLTDTWKETLKESKQAFSKKARQEKLLSIFNIDD